MAVDMRETPGATTKTHTTYCLYLQATNDNFLAFPSNYLEFDGRRLGWVDYEAGGESGVSNAT